ncbi:MAG: SRPBCC family protein [Gammaproteobacteria bacterium]|nr:SRPBCC family protein [Gammaproteobacteria bacterium]
MATFCEEIEIYAPVKSVWSVLADVGEIHSWNPGVMKSYLTSELSTGEGTCRRCELVGMGYLDEVVTRWVPEKYLTMKVVGTDLPFGEVAINFTLDVLDDKTMVKVNPVYRLKYGYVGKALDVLFVRRSYRKGMRALLQGLKRKVELGVSDRVERWPHPSEQ